MNTTWWQLHVRVARGEALGEAEQLAYEAGLQQLADQEVKLDESADIVAARATVAELEAEHDALAARRRQLDAEIALLEKALSPKNRQALSA